MTAGLITSIDDGFGPKVQLTYKPLTDGLIYAKGGWDLDGSVLPVVTTTNTYDSWGNATQIVTSTNDGFSKNTTNTYTNDAVNWILGRLTRTEVTDVTP